MAGSFDLTGKTALITGSSRGIGKAIALELAAHGAEILIHCSENVKAAGDAIQEARARGRKAWLLQAELGRAGAAGRLRESAAALVAQVDILVLNASVQCRRKWHEVGSEEFDRQIAVNLKSSLELIQLFAPAMMERRWGRVLAIGSVQQTRPHPEMIVYSASKAAQMNMVITLARELAGFGVTVNNLSPGVIETDRNRDALSDEAYRRGKLSSIPCGYFGKPADCASAALLLCSEEGGYIREPLEMLFQQVF